MNHYIPQYDFYKHKYGDELLIDVVPLNTIKKYLKEQPVHILTYYDITIPYRSSSEPGKASRYHLYPARRNTQMGR